MESIQVQKKRDLNTFLSSDSELDNEVSKPCKLIKESNQIAHGIVNDMTNDIFKKFSDETLISQFPKIDQSENIDSNEIPNPEKFVSNKKTTELGQIKQDTQQKNSWSDLKNQKINPGNWESSLDEAISYSKQKNIEKMSYDSSRYEPVNRTSNIKRGIAAEFGGSLGVVMATSLRRFSKIETEKMKLAEEKKFKENSLNDKFSKDIYIFVDDKSSKNLHNKNCLTSIDKASPERPEISNSEKSCNDNNTELKDNEVSQNFITKKLDFDQEVISGTGSNAKQSHNSTLFL